MKRKSGHYLQSQQPALSLIIATFGRTTQLQRCLESLSNYKGDVEIILVDQNEDERLQPVLSRLDGHLHVTRIRSSRKCASLARNLGASHARGIWIGFPDDDCWYSQGALARILQRIRRSDADLFSGLIVAPTGKPAMLRWPEEECVITSARVRRTVTESSLFLKREVFFFVDGFDPIFGPGSRFAAEEGVDLLRRLHRHKPEVRMLFSPEIHIHHEEPCAYADESSLQKTVSYCHARGACAARHWRPSAIPRMALEVGRITAGCLLFRGLRRKCKVQSLTAYVKGFGEYWQWRSEMSAKRPALQTMSFK